MESNLYKNIIFIFLVSLTLYSCSLNSASTVETSDDATISAFSINDNDSSENASSAVFTIDDEKNIIYNVDSLPYNTRIDSLIPSITFESSDGFIINDSLTYDYYTTIKAIDFKNKVKVTNIASDGETKKTYYVDLRVHKIDPYQYVWSQLTSQIGADVFENQKAVLYKNALHFYTNSGINTYLYTSTDGATWVKKDVNGLPADIVFLNNIDVFNNQILLLYGTEIYSTTDGINWSKLTTDNVYKYKSLICEFQNKLFAVGQNISTGNYSIISSTNATSWNEESILPTDFPVTGFAATTFKPKYGNKKMLVVGGNDKNGSILNTRWSTEDGMYWVNLKNAKSSFGPLSNAGVAYYGSRLLLFDTYYSNTSLKYIRNSLDYGLTWAKADTTQNRPHDLYKIREKASVVLNPTTQTLYVIGGKYSKVDEGFTVLSDVWQVKVNYYKFKPEEWSDY